MVRQREKEKDREREEEREGENEERKNLVYAKRLRELDDIKQALVTWDEFLITSTEKNWYKPKRKNKPSKFKCIANRDKPTGWLVGW